MENLRAGLLLAQDIVTSKSKKTDSKAKSDCTTSSRRIIC